jgi:transposase
MEDTEPIAGYPTKRALLENLYVEEGLSISEIARRVGVSTTAVERWLKLLGIPRRGRGGNNNQARIGWKLHRLSQRVVFGLSLRELSKMVSASESRVYKYKEGVTATWNSASLARPQG